MHFFTQIFQQGLSIPLHSTYSIENMNNDHTYPTKPGERKFIDSKVTFDGLKHIPWRLFSSTKEKHQNFPLSRSQLVFFSAVESHRIQQQHSTWELFQVETEHLYDPTGGMSPGTVAFSSSFCVCVFVLDGSWLTVVCDISWWDMVNGICMNL